MSMLRNLSIGPRLALAFGVILLLLICSVGAGVWQMRQLTDTVNTLATTDNEKLQMVVRWRQTIDLNWIRTKAAMLDGDAVRIAAWQKEMDTTSEISTASRKRVIEMIQSPEGKAMIKDVDDARAAYRNPRAELLKRRAGGEDVSAALQSQLRPLADSYTGTLQKLEAHQTKRYDDSLALAEMTSQKAQTFMLVGGVL